MVTVHRRARKQTVFDTERSRSKSSHYLEISQSCLACHFAGRSHAQRACRPSSGRVQRVAEHAHGFEGASPAIDSRAIAAGGHGAHVRRRICRSATLLADLHGSSMSIGNRANTP